MTNKTSGPDIGRRLAAARMERGLSQAIVARIAGLAPAYLSRIENGRVHPTLRTAAKVATALRVSLDDLLGVTRGPHRRGTCPVSRTGVCLMDLVRAEARSHAGKDEEIYTPRQLRLLRRFNDLLLGGSPDLLKALEVLLAQIGPAPGRHP
jgi:transcriptional regulator with XRE-family HTH domain